MSFVSGKIEFPHKNQRIFFKLEIMVKIEASVRVENELYK